ncbi:MAG: transcription antitermination factor NusB [Treponema sp.]|jgi:N utilization substance protein B|nr:transcription antitermination factor NusB [Treponema sp.]
MASRRKGRILAFQALYSWDTGYSQTGDISIPDGLLDFPWIEAPAEPQSGAVYGSSPVQAKPLDEETAVFSRLLVTGAIENIDAVDSMIKKHLENWEIKRLNRVDLAVLRMSVFSLMFQTDIHPSIVIDEAVDISKEYGTDDSYRFVNGVLDSIRKTLAAGTTTEPMQATQ